MAANVAGFDAQFNLGGTSAPSYTADSSATALTGTSTNALTATFSTVGPVANAQQPTITRAKWYLSLSNFNAATTMGAIDLWLQDAQNTPVLQFVDSIPAPQTATAGQGGEYCGDIYIAQGTAMANNIVSVKANVVLGGATHTATGQLRIVATP